MILLIMTVLYLIGEIYSICLLLKPIDDIIEYRKRTLKEFYELGNEKYVSIIMTTLFISIFIYLSNLRVNNNIFLIYSLILELDVIVQVFHTIWIYMDFDNRINTRCSKKYINFERVFEIVSTLYGIIVLIKIFL